MAGLDGIEATRRITAATPHIGVVVLTMFEDDDSVFAALRAGARGNVLKGALRNIHSGSSRPCDSPLRSCGFVCRRGPSD
jgi:DNA-binding NarL/FixJ family response regulator